MRAFYRLWCVPKRTAVCVIGVIDVVTGVLLVLVTVFPGLLDDLLSRVLFDKDSHEAVTDFRYLITFLGMLMVTSGSCAVHGSVKEHASSIYVWFFVTLISTIMLTTYVASMTLNAALFRSIPLYDMAIVSCFMGLRIVSTVYCTNVVQGYYKQLRLSQSSLPHC